MISAPREPLEFEFTYTRSDAVDTNALFGRSRRRRAAAFFAALSVFGIALWLLAPIWSSVLLVIFGAVSSLVQLSPAPVWLAVRMNESVLRVGTKMKVTLTPKGMSIQATGRSASYEWQAVTTVLEDRKAIVLLQGKAPLVLMPKRVLDSPGALQGFKDFVRSAAPRAVWP